LAPNWVICSLLWSTDRLLAGEPIRRYGRLLCDDGGRATVTVGGVVLRPARRPGARRLLFFDGFAGAAQVLPEGAGRIGGALGQVIIEVSQPQLDDPYPPIGVPDPRLFMRPTDVLQWSLCTLFSGTNMTPVCTIFKIVPLPTLPSGEVPS